MKKRLLLCFGIILCLTSCREAGQTDTKAETPAGAETSADVDLSTEAAAEVASGWQFVPGYGICGPNQPVIYELAPESGQPEAKTEGAEVKLISAFYQAGYMSVRMEIRDYSVTQIPDDEVQELLKKERENQKLQDENGSPEWDTGYFCLDEEKQVYGRSAFWDKVREQEKQGKRDEIRGVSIPETGYLFNSSGQLNEYEEFLEKGYYTTIAEKRITRRQPLLKEPEGTYKLSLNGFEDPITFTLVKAREYDDLNKMDGITEHDGFYSMAQAQVTADGLRLSLYAYPAEGYSMYPKPDSLIYRMEDGSMQEAVIERHNSAPMSEWTECGFPKGGYSELLYRLPEDGKAESMSCLISQSTVTSTETSEILVIPLPKEEESMEERLEFRDAVVTLTGVKRLDERYEYGTDENNQRITKPMVYVSARAEVKAEDKSLEGVWGCQPGEEGIGSQNLYSSIRAIPDFKEENDKGRRELRGFEAYYDEGDTELRLQFQNFTYLWNREFILPVKVVTEFTDN